MEEVEIDPHEQKVIRLEDKMAIVLHDLTDLVAIVPLDKKENNVTLTVLLVERELLAKMEMSNVLLVKKETIPDVNTEGTILVTTTALLVKMEITPDLPAKTELLVITLVRKILVLTEKEENSTRTVKAMSTNPVKEERIALTVAAVAAEDADVATTATAPLSLTTTSLKALPSKSTLSLNVITQEADVRTYSPMKRALFKLNTVPMTVVLPLAVLVMM